MKHLAFAALIPGGILLGILTSSPALEGAAITPHPHESVQCGQCHQLAAATSDGGSLNVACGQCHGFDDEEIPAVANAFHQEEGRDCRTCHVFHDPASFRVAGEVFSLSGRSARTSTQCATCHSSAGRHVEVSEGHRQAAQVFYHGRADDLATMTPSEACLSCHAWDAQSSDGMDAVPTFNEHASHPYGVAVQAGRGRGGRRMMSTLDPRLPLFGGRIECQTCHDLTASTENYLIPYEPPQALCLGCHQVMDPAPVDDFLVEAPEPTASGDEPITAGMGMGSGLP